MYTLNLIVYGALWLFNIDPETNTFFVETQLPTPRNGRVVMVFLRGKESGILKITSLSSHTSIP
jgi:hypothetical protein